MKRNIPSLTLFINKAGQLHKIIFRTVEEQEDYKKEEREYCKKETIAYYGAALPKQRKELLDKLYIKRKQFARHKGYAPKREDRFTWVYSPNFDKLRA